MLRIPVKHEIVLAAMAIALALCVHFLQATPALSATQVTATGVTATGVTATGVTSQPEVPLVELAPGAIATAPEAPKLVPAVLGGKPVYVLYSTRANDIILVRCYPTYQPSLTVKAMSGQPGVKEGTLTCKAGDG